MQQCLRRRLFSATVLRRHPPAQVRFPIFIRNSSSSFGSNTVDGDDDWNDAWETAWLPDKLDGKNRAPWEADVNFPDSHSCGPIVLPSDADPDTKAFVEEMDERWDERRMAAAASSRKQNDINEDLGPLRKNKEDEDYRLRKQKIHAGLWMKEIEKMEESRLADPDGTGTVEAADIDRLLDSCSEIFDSSHDELNNKKIPSISNVKAKPDGWESTSKTPDGNIWEVTQREEDILLQEFERRIAFSKFQIASFIKTHIFSRRRPIDGWRYMIEELGPNARKGKGSVQRVPSLADSSTQPFKDDRTSNVSNFGAYKRR